VRGRGRRASRIFLGAAVALVYALAFASGAGAKARPLKTPALKAILFLSNSKEVVREAPAMPGRPIDASRVPALATAKARKLLDPFIGKTITPALLNRLRNALEGYFAAIHQRFVSITVPSQVATSGTLQVVVLVSRVGKLSVAGNRWFDKRQYLDAIHLRRGEPIDSRALDDDIAWLNRNPYRHAQVVASAGKRVGTTDFTILAQDRFPVAVTAGVDNTGNSATGLNRLNAGFDWGNAFWRGDDLNYRFTTSPNLGQLRQHQLSYAFNLPSRDTLTVSGGLADFSAAPGNSPISTKGRTKTLSLRYDLALPAVGALSQSVALSFDFKSTNNNVLFGGTNVFPTTTEIDQFSLSYSGRAPDSLGSTGFNLSLTGSPGGLTRLNTDAAFATQQAGATANYIYSRLAFDRLTNLPAGLSWDATGTLQVSGATLLPSEQLGFGGPGSNRGFVTYGTTRDEGFQLSNELRAPAIQTGLPHLMGLNRQADSLVPYLFVDYGVGRNHANTPSTWLSMTTVGLGLTYQFSRYGMIRFSYGVPVQRIGQVGDTLRSQFGAQFTY
jgi:hemolysin activation/secretion protein